MTSTPNKNILLKQLPAVDELMTRLESEHLPLPRESITSTIRSAIQWVREIILTSEEVADVPGLVWERLQIELNPQVQPNLKRVINGTGIVLHTGLGRAPVSSAIWEKLTDRLAGYCNVEFNLTDGSRGERNDHVSSLLRVLTGAENAIAVNNNAAAVLLMLNTMADGQEVIISRGQQVEIGGSFRIPDVIRKSGCQMVEVGTTNRTHLPDYEDAISVNTGAILVAHPSNYRVTGFTAEVLIEDLVQLAHSKNLPLILDLGSGALVDLPDIGLPHEPQVRQFIQQGVDLVSFSGDKLLGGPQAGIICGSNRFVQQIHRNALYRALRCDKVSFALLEETLRTFYTPHQISAENMTITLLKRTREELQNTGRQVLAELGSDLINRSGIVLQESVVHAGSGSLPTDPIPSMALAFTNKTISADELSQNFRHAAPPVIGYIQEDTFFIDLKAILPTHESELISVISRVCQ